MIGLDPLRETAIRRPRLLSALAAGLVALAVLAGAEPPSVASAPDQTFTPADLPRSNLPGEWRTYANGDDILTLIQEGETLWAGTRAGGLIRWDLASGNFRQFLRPQEPLASNTIYDIDIDEQGRKWLATSGGLTLFDDKGTDGTGDDAWRTYTRENTFNGLPSDDVRAVVVDGDVVWVGGWQVWNIDSEIWEHGGIGRLDTQGTPRTDDDTWDPLYTFDTTAQVGHDGSRVLGLVSNNVNDLLVAESGLWVATSGHHSLERPANPDKPREWQLVHGGLSHAVLDDDGRPDKTQWSAYTCENPMLDTSGRPLISCDMRKLVAAPGERIWAAAGGMGAVSLPMQPRLMTAGAVFRFDSASGRSVGHVDTVALGSDVDVVWIGDRDGGLWRLKHQGTLRNTGDDEWTQTGVSDGLPSDRVQAIHTSAETIHVGLGPERGVGHGIAQLSTMGAMESHLRTAGIGPVPPTNFFTAVATSPEGSRWDARVWFGTGSRVQRTFGHGVVALDTRGTAAGADDGFEVWDRANTDPDGEAPFTGLPGDNIHAVVATDDHVWVGAAESEWNMEDRRYDDGGLAAFDGQRWAPRVLPDADEGLGSVASLTLGCDDDLWIGTGSRWTDGMALHVLSVISTMDPAGDSWARVEFPDVASNEIRDALLDCTTDEAWVASPHHAFRGDWSDGGLGYRAPDGTWERVDTRHGLEFYSAARIRGEAYAVGRGPAGDVWAGGFGTRRMTETDLIASSPFWPAVVNRRTDEGWANTVFEDLGVVLDMDVDPQDRVWVAVSRWGTARESVQPETWREDRHLFGLLLWAAEAGWQGVGFSQGAPPDVSAMAIEPDGTLWLATEGWGIARYRPQGPSPTPTHTPDAPSPTPTHTPTATATRTPGSAQPTTPPATATPTRTGEATSTRTTPSSPRLDFRIFAPSVATKGDSVEVSRR